MSLKLQYIVVFIILIGVVVWIVWSLLKKKYNGGGQCSGCSLSKSCGKAKKLRKKENPGEECRP